MPKHFFVLICMVFTFLLHSNADAASPLLQEGKQTIYQRIITHPSAHILQSPSASASVLQDNVKPFTVFYVYARQESFVQVGSLGAGPIGWIKKEMTTDWNQSLTLLLTERSTRNPVLFFNSEQALKDVCQASDMEARLQNLQEAVASKNSALLQNSSVIAAESNEREGSVAASRFYLMPILGMTDPFVGVKFLKVASIDPGNTQKTEFVQDPSRLNPSASPLQPRMAIAFVIDTTISMKPYIDQSLNVVRNVYDQLENSDLHDDVAFGVVTFRSSPVASPETEYESQVVSDLTTAKNREILENNLAKVREATKSTHAFRENSPSGIKTALDGLSWDDYPTRLIILITDAGPLRSTDPYSTVKMDMPELADYARSKGVRISALHIKSPSGKSDHAKAAADYKTLTKSADYSIYLPIEAQTQAQGAKEFKEVSLALTEGVVNMVRMTLDGKLITKPGNAPLPPSASPKERAKNLAGNIGYAMQLDYLGRVNEVRAPEVVDSWIADMDLQKLARGNHSATVEVAVLLTKNQLNDLSNQLKIIIDNAERTKRTDAKDFFQGILSASTRAARDPNSPMPEGKNLSQMGVLAEFLDGLPYKSDIMLLREEDWYRMSIGQQTTFINRLKSRLARYEEYDKDSSHWESFGATNPGDWMYRVPLTMLP